jgi:hypothetical protein
MQYDCTLQERKERVVKRKLEFIESIGSMRTAINKQLSLAESAVEKYFREVHDRLTAIQKREEAVKFNLISIGLKQADLFS